MIPILPCASIDEVREFWRGLGCQVVWFQRRPNPYVALRRGGMEIHYYGLDGHRPEDSHSTCSVVVEDTGLIFQAFADGLRAVHGRLPLTGVPRITRPRARANNEGLSGFSLVDPAGNWVRFTRRPPSGASVTSAGATTDAPLAQSTAVVRGALSPLARALSDAVVQGDSHGDPAQAHKILAGAVRRSSDGADPIDRVNALGYLAELSVRVEDPAAARKALDQLHAVATDLDTPARAEVTEALEAAAELRATL
jgi:hypothetical protein